MSGFNEESAMRDQLQGASEIPTPPAQPLATGTPDAPSVVAGATGLAWWDAMKYYWRKSANGGSHLAPQDSFVSDVLDRTDHYMTTIAKDLGEDDYAEFATFAELITQVIQAEDAVDTSGIEGNAARRNVLNRLIIARKICGASAVSAEHRVTNELSRETGDVEKLKGDSEGFYASDVEKRERWGFKAIRLEFVAKAIADGEVIPTDDAAFSQLLANRIGRSLYDDAVERGNKLKRPAQQQAVNTSKPSREELLALTA
jgi:hypothetical protein